MADGVRSENVKKSMFKRWDIAVYALIAALIVVSVIVFITQRKTAEAFEVYIGGEKVLTYSFDDDTYVVYDNERVMALGDTQFIVFCGGGYNVLSVYPAQKEAVIIDADCSGKECTTMKLSTGTIICAPHGLTVKAVGRITDPVVG